MGWESGSRCVILVPNVERLAVQSTSLEVSGKDRKPWLAVSPDNLQKELPNPLAGNPPEKGPLCMLPQKFWEYAWTVVAWNQHSTHKD